MKSVGQAITSSYGKLPEKKFIKKSKCKDCEENIEIYEMAVVGGADKGKKIKVPYGCKCEDRKLVKNAMEISKNNMEKKILKTFNDHSLINKDLKKANFVNFHPKNESQMYAKRLSIKYVDIFNPDKMQNLSFHGGYGVGKSHLAKSIADEVIKKGYTAVFIKVPMLLRKIRSTYNGYSEETESDIFRALEKVDLLILDDLGAENESGFTEEKIFELVDMRQGMNTIYTTNYSPDDLKKILNERNYSRIMYKTEKVEITGENYRLK